MPTMLPYPDGGRLRRNEDGPFHQRSGSGGPTVVVIPVDDKLAVK